MQVLHRTCLFYKVIPVYWKFRFNRALSQILHGTYLYKKRFVIYPKCNSKWATWIITVWEIQPCCLGSAAHTEPTCARPAQTQAQA